MTALAGTAATAAAEVHEHGGAAGLDTIILIPATLLVVVYIGGALSSRRNGRSWPWYRVALWCAGVVAAAAPILGPFAAATHESFVAHALGHVVGGMLAPLLLVLAAPVTLALRTLDTTPARRLSRLLGSLPVRLLVHPVTMGIVSTASLWLVYATWIYDAAHGSALVHVFVHVHTVIVGYLFTAAIVGVDPAPHPTSRVLRAVVLVLTMAAHAVLAKHLFANPPASAELADGQLGAQTMYYVGGAVELVIVVVFCAQWYRASGRRLERDAARAAA